MNVHAVLLLVVVLATACEPRFGLEVSANGSGPVFALKTCSGKEAVLNQVLVTDAITGDPSCSIAHTSPSPAVTSWEYGKRPAGYLMSSCVPLETGRVYEVVSPRPAATRRFKVLAHGAVEALGSPCD